MLTPNRSPEYAILIERENELKYHFHAFSGTNSSNNFEPSIKVQKEPGTLTVEVTEFTKDKARVNLKYSDSNDVLSQSVSIPNRNNDPKSIIKEAIKKRLDPTNDHRNFCKSYSLDYYWDEEAIEKASIAISKIITDHKSNEKDNCKQNYADTVTKHANAKNAHLDKDYLLNQTEMKSFQETYEKDKKQSFKYITRYELKNTLDGYKDIRTRFSFWNFMDKMLGYIARKIINGFNYGYSYCTSSPYKPTDWMITSNENISNLRSLEKTTPAGNSVSINQIQRALSGQEKETFSNQKQVSPQKEKNKSPSGSIQTLIALRSKMQYPPQTQESNNNKISDNEERHHSEYVSLGYHSD